MVQYASLNFANLGMSGAPLVRIIAPLHRNSDHPTISEIPFALSQQDKVSLNLFLPKEPVL